MATYTNLRFYAIDPNTIFSTTLGATSTYTGPATPTGMTTIVDNESGGTTTLDDDNNGSETATGNVYVNGLTSTNTTLDAEAVWTIRDTLTGQEFEIVQLDVESGGAAGQYLLSEQPLEAGRNYEIVYYNSNPDAEAGTAAFTYGDYQETNADGLVESTSGYDTIDASYTGDVDGDVIDGGDSPDATRTNLDFNWSAAGFDNQDITSGIVQDTGGIQVDVSFATSATTDEVSIDSSTLQYVATGETFDNNSSLYLRGTHVDTDTVTTVIEFSSVSGSGFDDEVQNVTFRVNDIDQGGWTDELEIRAYDADGNLVSAEFNLQGNDSDTTTGSTLTGGNNQGDNPGSQDGSALVTIAGPVARIELEYGNGQTAGQVLYVSDIQFEATTSGDQDLVYAGDGNDVVFTGLDNDTVYGGTGDDSISGEAGNDQLFGEAGNDTLEGGAGADTLNGDAGADVLDGGTGDDILDGGTGNDTLQGGIGADTLQGGDGDDLVQVSDGFGADSITGGEAGETTGLTGGDVLDGSGLTGDVTVDFTTINAADPESGTLSMGADTLSFEEIEILRTGAGNDSIIGTDAAENIATGAGQDTVNTGAGDDVIALYDGQSGGDGVGDTIVLADGSGNDTVYEFDGPTDLGGGVYLGIDHLDVSGLTTGTRPVNTHDVTVGDDGSGNAILFFPNGETVTLMGIAPAALATPQALNAIGIPLPDGIVRGTAAGDLIDSSYSGDNDGDMVDGGDAIPFGAGADDDTILAGAGDDTVLAGAGDDNVAGDAGADVLGGGAGDDLMVGGDGADTLTGGLGSDTMIGGADADVFQQSTTLNGDSFSGGEITSTGSDFDTVDFSGMSGPVTISFSGDEAGSIDDGSGTASFDQIEALILSDYNDFVTSGGDTLGHSITAGAGDDTIWAGLGDDTLSGGTGADEIFGDTGNDIISGGTGNDDLGGDAGNDTVSGDAGDDYVQGGAGNDSLSGGDDFDTLIGGAGDDTMAGDAGDDTLSGGDGADLMSGGTGADTLDGGAGDDTMTGEDGDDLFVLEDGFGTDTITGGETGEGFGDVIDVSLMTSGVTVNLSAGDPADGESGTLSDGTNTASFSEIEIIGTGSGDDSVIGSTGADMVATGYGADTVDGGAGDDGFDLGSDGFGLGGDGAVDTVVMADGDGADTIYYFEAPTDNGDGTFDGKDQLDLSGLTDAQGNPVHTTDVTIGGDGLGNAVLSFPGGESLTLLGVTPAQVSDPAALEAMGIPGLDYVVAGTTGADLIDGAYVGDVEGDMVDAGDAADGSDDDYIDANAGNDTVLAGAGEDYVSGGAGNDSLLGYEGSDSIDGGDGDDTIQLTDQFGDDVITGGAGAETAGDTLDMSGLTTDTTVDLSGNDPEAGTVSNGTDTASFAEIENIVLGGGADTLVLADGSGADAVQGFTAPTDDGDGTYTGVDLLDVSGLTDAGGDPVDVYDVTVGDDGSGNAILSFLNGETLTLFGVSPSAVSSPQQLIAMGVPAPDGIVYGTAGNDTIDGSYAGDNDGDVVDGGDAILPNTAGDDDSIEAGAGDDSVLAGAGDDTVLGGDGADTLDGGPGTDNLEGGADADRFAITGGGTDTVVGGETGTDADTLDLSGAGSGANIVFSGDEAGNSTIDGDTVDFAEIEQLTATSGNDTVDMGADSGGMVVDLGAGADSLTGGSGSDTITAGDGADTITGGAGDDQIRFGSDDIVWGEDGDDTFTVDLADLNGGALSVDGGETGETGGDVLNITGGTVVYDADPENGTVTWGDGSVLTFSNIETVNHVPCFTEHSMITTRRGLVPAGQLRIGDMVQTRDEGMQPIRWIGSRRMTGAHLAKNPKLNPVTIGAGALGNGLPERDLLVSPQHRMLVSSVKTQLWFAEDEVLVAARHLIFLDGIEQIAPDSVTYVHFMFDRHQVVMSEGTWSESFQPGDHILRGMDDEQRAELAEIFPELQCNGGTEPYPAVRLTLKRHEVPLLFFEM